MLGTKNTLNCIYVNRFLSIGHFWAFRVPCIHSLTTSILIDQSCSQFRGLLDSHIVCRLISILLASVNMDVMMFLVSRTQAELSFLAFPEPLNGAYNLSLAPLATSKPLW